jgi:hypothetical protein
MMIFFIYLGIGIISNFIGPLAKELSISQKHTLKENKNKSWFYRYSLIVLIRTFMTLLHPVFYFTYYVLNKKPEVPESFENKLNAGLVNSVRNISKHNNTAPTEKTSDDKIIEIYRLICTSFRNESTKRNEHIPANSLDIIAMKFFKIYEEFGEDFMKEHLEYELKKYAVEGLRPEYQNGISLI